MRDLLARLVNREAVRNEATLQADIRQLLLAAPLDLDEGDLHEILLESPVGDRRRIDIEVGATVIEVKRSLQRGPALEKAVSQLAGYVLAREAETDQRYVGILTDGAEWRCFRSSGNELRPVSSITVRKPAEDLESLLFWLEGVLATTRNLLPRPAEIEARLGAGSSSYSLDRSTLAELYEINKENPSVAMKRALWARLLTTALGSHFQDTDELFVEHTLLVNSSEIIAHAVLGLDVEGLSPASLLSGSKFEESGIYGVVEADFFDWVLEVTGGDRFVRTLARRLSRFDWSAVEHDVLKILYESIINAETRKKLGEYYTPDWLAEAMVEELIQDPLKESCLDPSCGSGTFLFHAVRRYLSAAEANGRSVSQALLGATSCILGMDLHPVAVTLARVTYVLALGKERLRDPSRPEIQIPVYLGDSLQWYQRPANLWTEGSVAIQVDDERSLFSEELQIPGEVLGDARIFDRLIDELARRAAARRPDSQVPSLSGLFSRLAIPLSAQGKLQKTFATMCDLHDQGRDHIWGYYVRNLARPVWISRPENRVSVLIGNPPWLAYRHMPGPMQAKFREMSESRLLWHGAKMATQQDLSALFVARTVQLYLKKGGSFGFVLPNAVIDRGQFLGFRSGIYPDDREPVTVTFGEAWDLRRLRPHFFPRGSAVVFGCRGAEASQLPATVEAWTGRLPPSNSSWSEIKELVSRDRFKHADQANYKESLYRSRFNNGATVFPRTLLVVNEEKAGSLGLPQGRRKLVSRRSPYEKKPWKDLDSLRGVVETEFVRPMHLGETVLPYRLLTPLEAIVPYDGKHLLSSENERIDLYPGLKAWWTKAESLWERHRSSDRLSLLGQIDFRKKLSSQLPLASHRIVYTKSGMHVAAARLESRRTIIDHTLYWAAVASTDEALFLCSVLNSSTITQLARPLMSYGKDERHIDKHIWKLPIPLYDSESKLHRELVEIAREAELKIADLAIDETKHFSASRRKIRQFLEASPVGQRIEKLVAKLLG